jgi:predicted aminopeptidase
MGVKRTGMIVRTLLAAAPALLLNSCYITTQGYHLLRHQITARPVERVRRAAAADPEQIRKYEFFSAVESIRRFGIEELGLTADSAFTTYVKTDRGYLADVVSAVRVDRFERKEWSFPFFGAFPYKGFYQPGGANRLATQLQSGGWDVHVRRVDAFSTLGFFRDPLYSFMIDYEESRLADLILHEMAHATLWVPSEGQFNEEFATFVGRAGARAYLVERYGPEDPRVAQLEKHRVDATTFREDMLRLRDRLHLLYTGDTGDTGEDAPADRKEDDPSRESDPSQDHAGVRRSLVLREKAVIIEAFQRDFAATYDQRYRGDRFRAAAEIPINNAYLDLFTVYTGNIHLFEEFHRLHGGPLSDTIQALVALVEYRRVNERPLDALLAAVAIKRGTAAGPSRL